MALHLYSMQAGRLSPWQVHTYRILRNNTFSRWRYLWGNPARRQSTRCFGSYCCCSLTFVSFWPRPTEAHLQLCQLKVCGLVPETDKQIRKSCILTTLHATCIHTSMQCILWCAKSCQNPPRLKSCTQVSAPPTSIQDTRRAQKRGCSTTTAKRGAPRGSM